jgi:hypothetical protein
LCAKKGGERKEENIKKEQQWSQEKTNNGVKKCDCEKPGAFNQTVLSILHG